MDKVSVILPVYNGEKYLERCLDALLKQTYKNNEFICVNDGSVDNTKDMLFEYQKKDNRFIVINKENTGVSDSRNVGIEKASGDYICFCDVDDYYEPNYIETMLSTVKNSDADAVRCNYKVIDSGNKFIESGTLENSKLTKNQIVSEFIPKCLDGSIPCFSYLLMVKREALRTKFPVYISMMEDVVFYIDVLLNINSLIILNEPLYTIMFNNEGATNNPKNYIRNINNILLVNNDIKTILINYKLDDKNNIDGLNSNNLRAISDFIFRYYLSCGEVNDLFVTINTDKLFLLIDNTNISKFDFARRILLKLFRNRKIFLLKIYFEVRKIIYNFKRR